MLDIKFIRENLETVKKAAKDKNREVDWDKLLGLDEKRRGLIKKRDDLKSAKNKTNEAIKAALRELSSGKVLTESEKRKAIAAALDSLQKKTTKATDEKVQRNAIRTAVTKLQERPLDQIEEELRTVEEQFNKLMLTIPNIPDKAVPIGKDASGNVEIKKWGEVPKFDFKPLDHMELAKKLDLVDFERGVKAGGFRTYFLKNEAALLEIAVLTYAYQKLAKKGYIPLVAPSLVKEFTLVGNGQFPWGREEVYHLEKDDVYLAGTAEVPVTAYFSGEILNEKDLPKKFVAFSPCFRREAGSYGKDTKGLYRLHQFNKVEQVVINTNDYDGSLKLHEELLANSEEILQDLKLPYRVVLMCTGDMGEPQVKKYDVETWMPGRNAYGETMSNSFMGEFQTRRLNIRYKAKDGTVKYTHSLNNTAVASPRILIAILENYQQKDGSVVVPEVLREFVGKERIKVSQ